MGSARCNRTGGGWWQDKIICFSSSSPTSSLTWIYLPAHLLALFSDWLQGPYFFQLYRHHGHSDGSIALLFLAGYVSSCFLGSLSGPLADKYGRRKMGQVFCVICALNCFLKIFPSFYVLLLGRILSGVSTSCLYSVFESWYVAENQARGLPKESLSSTLALVTTCNSLLAIFAGLLSDLLVQGLSLGPLAPFLAALPCLAAGLLMISLGWTENYGSQTGSLVEKYREGASSIFASPTILRLGIVQSLVEASMFTFVFLWTPTLSAGNISLPLGKIFAAFMVSIMVGSYVFRAISTTWKPQRGLLLSTILFLTSTLIASQLATSTTFASKPGCLLAFVLIEVSLGIYFPSIGTLRSLHLPGSHRSTIINLFRVPLNLITATTLMLVKSGQLEDRGLVFGLLTFFLLVAAIVAASIQTKEEKRE